MQPSAKESERERPAEANRIGGVTGAAGFIQKRTSPYEGAPNFEVVVPASPSGLQHFWRDNNDPDLPWIGPMTFGTEFGEFSGASLIQSTYGHLEVVAVLEDGSGLMHFWRDDRGVWQHPTVIANTSRKKGGRGDKRGRA